MNNRLFVVLALSALAAPYIAPKTTAHFLRKLAADVTTIADRVAPVVVRHEGQ